MNGHNFVITYNFTLNKVSFPTEELFKDFLIKEGFEAKEE
jgi:hypothetical protein